MIGFVFGKPISLPDCRLAEFRQLSPSPSPGTPWVSLSFLFISLPVYMGNAPSQPPVSDAVASSLSPRAQQRLSQAPYANFFEAAAVTTHPVPVRRRKRPTATNSEASSTRSSVKSGSSSSVTTRTVSEKRPSRATTVRALSSDSSTLISDATSLPPPKLDYTVLKGRRYPQYPDARFFLPCDDDESDRIVILVKRRKNHSSSTASE